MYRKLYLTLNCPVKIKAHMNSDSPSCCYVNKLARLFPDPDRHLSQFSVLFVPHYTKITQHEHLIGSQADGPHCTTMCVYVL